MVKAATSRREEREKVKKGRTRGYFKMKHEATKSKSLSEKRGLAQNKMERHGRRRRGSRLEHDGAGIGSIFLSATTCHRNYLELVSPLFFFFSSLAGKTKCTGGGQPGVGRKKRRARPYETGRTHYAHARTNTKEREREREREEEHFPIQPNAGQETRGGIPTPQGVLFFLPLSLSFCAKICLVRSLTGSIFFLSWIMEG